MSYGKPIAFSRFEIDSSSDSFAVSGVGAGTIATGFYYTTDASLMATLQAGIRAIGGAAASMTVRISTTTGKVTLAAGTFTLEWTDTDLRDILGFTGSTASVTSGGVTGANQALYLWNPNCYPSDSVDPPHGDGHPRHGALATQGIGGPLVGTTMTVLTDKRFSFSTVPARKVWKASEVVTNESLERFFRDPAASASGLAYFSRILWYPDRDDTATYLTLVPTKEQARGLDATWLGKGQPFCRVGLSFTAYV